MTKRKAVTAPRAGQSGAARADLSKPAGADATAAGADATAAGASAAAAGSGPAGDGAPAKGSGPASDSAAAAAAGSGPAGDGPVVGDGPAVGGGPVLGRSPAAGDVSAAEGGPAGGDTAVGGPVLGKGPGAGGASAPEVGGDGPGGGVEPYAPGSGFAVPGGEEAPKPEVAGGPLDIVITIGGLVVAVLLAVALAVFEAFLAPLRVSDLGLSGTGTSNMRIPLALVLALVTNPMLGWFAFTTTGRRFAALLPAGAWCVVWILAAGRTTEGDLLITNDNWVGLLTLFAGPLAFAIGIYVTALRQRVAGSANSKATPLAPQSVGKVDTFPHRP
ncbi:hypothetical protein GCM10009827_042670 [Dactylosporangium maewongense]|uniref:Uncharacterized protein n=1 Tax=Dactylosporangium maewongense TaxID=634393 RepID=A0ABP4LED9_9ACTN